MNQNVLAAILVVVMIVTTIIAYMTQPTARQAQPQATSSVRANNDGVVPVQ
jgi:hypothetical protein